MSSFNMYPECSPFQHEMLQVDPVHTLYLEQCGNPSGTPVLFLHGGPGSGCNTMQRRFFDPMHYRIILFDQRGCGRSQPAGETTQNTTDDLVFDIEKIRKHLGINRWHIFGGSWGSTLALAYATQYPQTAISLTLRGVFLSRPHEIDWFLGQVALFFPDAWQALTIDVPMDQQENILGYYSALIFNMDTAISIPAAIRWNAFETSIMSLLPKVDTSHINGAVELARARVQIHYIQHMCFIDGERLLEQAKEKLERIPSTIVQGRYDMVCPPQTAWQLSQSMPHARFFMIADAGHSAMEEGTCQALLETTERYKALSAT
ncbi:prolyl aminopeptidase [Methylophilus aquaticus]|uniref:Proline iminopeptidase n=1 Tax=Methylophilus aquaticus TaxID=1971610 RepID=A0ABT9JSL3_9PROT|nr:prolyl aminopeptidase [Methylophilus aquaticus]MDP8567479.1 prolyl aminopeptidase [Methylophilus aquaticus]